MELISEKMLFRAPCDCWLTWLSLTGLPLGSDSYDHAIGLCSMGACVGFLL